MTPRMTRRRLLKTLGATGLGLALGTGRAPATTVLTASAQGETVQIPLSPGWNLISLPVLPGNFGLPDVLASIAGQYDMVYAYVAGLADPWRQYHTEAPALFNTLPALEARWGYWLRATRAATLVINGAVPATTVIPLVAGWNLVGYPSPHARPVSEALSDLGGKWTEIRTLVDGSWHSRTSGGGGDLTNMTPGRGYWLRMTEAASWTVLGAPLTPPPSEGRVVHSHSARATTWDGSDPAYWTHVDQAVTHEMVDQGIMALTGTSAIDAAWRAILPGYQAGQKIAIKVNFNNQIRASCDDTGDAIDAIIEPVNAVIRGLVARGVAEGDIWVYDAIRSIPTRFAGRCPYSGVQFLDNGQCRTQAGFGDTYVTFSPPTGLPTPPPIRLTNALANATYVINMPIMKAHSCAGVTLAFKNHLGSIDNPGALHDYMFVGCHAPSLHSEYNPMVDLYQSPHIQGKTVLTLADGLFACKAGENRSPAMWDTFGGQTPSSLFLSTDPVAIDCVMCDFLAAETGLPDGYDRYLRLANQAGLGMYERGEPWGAGYRNIDYRKIELG